MWLMSLPLINTVCGERGMSALLAVVTAMLHKTRSNVSPPHLCIKLKEQTSGLIMSRRTIKEQI